jgi:hypothetical protein
MRVVAALFACGLLAACAVQPGAAPPGTASTASAIDAAFTEDPRPEPTPLPARTPVSRLQREIERLPSAELARWIFPEEAGRIARVELFPARWGVLTYAYFWDAPRPTSSTGVCEVTGRGVSFRVENENSLTHQQRLDPPLTPFQTMSERRFRVAGSTLAGAAAPDCSSEEPYWRWAEAPSPEALHVAANLMEQAQGRARRSGSLGFRLSCRNMPEPEGGTDTARPSCSDARGFLQRLAPSLIKRVGRTQCEGEISRGSGGGCLAAEYHDPEAPGTYRFYMVRLAGTRAPQAVEIIEGMMPPH